MGLPESSILSKVNIVVSLVGIVFYAVGCLNPYWISKTFPIPKGREVESHMGLLTSCKTVSMQGQEIRKDCSAKGAADWQVISSGVACTGAILGVLGLILLILNVTLSLVAGKTVTRIFLVVLSATSAGFVTASLILYSINKNNFEVAPGLKIDYDFAWAFILTTVGVAVHYVLTVLVFIDFIREDQKRGPIGQIALKEPTVAYASDTKSGYIN